MSRPAALSRSDVERIQLMMEVRDRHGARVEAMLKSGANVNGSVRLRPLAAAVWFHRPRMVRLLLKNGADVEVPTTNPPWNAQTSVMYFPLAGERPLHLAVYSKNIEITRLLLEAGADPNSRTGEGFTPLMGLLSGPTCTRWRDIAEILFDAGGDLTLLDNSGCTTLHHAAVGGNVDMIRTCLTRALHMLNHVGNLGETELFMAAKEGNTSAVSFLLSVGAKHPQSEGHDCCPLVVAISLKHVEVVRLLIANGMQAIGGPAYALPMALAGSIRHGGGKLVHMMLTADGEDKQQEWARCGGSLAGPVLHYAAGYIKLYAVRALLAAGADYEAVDGAGQRAIDVIGTMDEDNPPMSPLSPRNPGRRRDPVMEAEIRRTLLRAPAFQARSWSWPIATRADAAVTSNDEVTLSSERRGGKPPPLCVNLFRPRGRNFFHQIAGR